jgi:hypothetical protein
VYTVCPAAGSGPTVSELPISPTANILRGSIRKVRILRDGILTDNDELRFAGDGMVLNAVPRKEASLFLFETSPDSGNYFLDGPLVKMNHLGFPSLGRLAFLAQSRNNGTHKGMA